MGLRVLCKYQTATLKSIEPLGNGLAKLVINQEGYPQKVGAVCALPAWVCVDVCACGCARVSMLCQCACVCVC